MILHQEIRQHLKVHSIRYLVTTAICFLERYKLSYGENRQHSFRRRTSILLTSIKKESTKSRSFIINGNEKAAWADFSAETEQSLSEPWLCPTKIGCKTQSSFPPQTLLVVLPFKLHAYRKCTAQSNNFGNH